MAGLFTLDSESLGVLDTNVLGGLGTGFVTGSTTSSGSVTGTLGHSGSVAGLSSSSGTVTGTSSSGNEPRGYPYRKRQKAPAFSGSVAGSSTSSGSVSGRVEFGGQVRGICVASGSGDGHARLIVKPVAFHAEGFVNGDLSDARKRQMKDERELELIGAW
jgi:hypothetical protein